MGRAFGRRYVFGKLQTSLKVHFSKSDSLGQEGESLKKVPGQRNGAQRGKKRTLSQSPVEKAKSRRVADFWGCLQQLVSFRFLCD